MILTTSVTILGALVLSGVTVTLPMETEVRGTEITLGEIARIDGEPADVARVSAIPIGYAPSPGYSRLLRDDRLAETVRRAAPGLAVRFAGEPACRVWPAIETIPSARLVDAARAALDELAAGVDATVAPASPVADLRVPLGAAPATLVVRREPRELRTGTLTIPVEVLVDGTTYRTVFTSWRVERFATVPVLARDVSAGEVLGPQLFERRRVRLESFQDGSALPGDVVVGAVLARDLVAGSTVSRTDVERPRIVFAGDVLVLEVKSGAIRARVPAEAQESGSIGDRIRVAASGRELSAVVRGRDLVEIDLGGSTR